VKRSKFIAFASPVQTADEAMAFFREVSDPAASHNCFAYKADGDTHRRFSDDGEPGGSAGRPIMAAVDGSGLDNVAVLVVR
jgi:putative IMPACT (imprinted ancient) family translation regulator